MTLTLTQAKQITRNTFWVVAAVLGLVLSLTPMQIGGVLLVTVLSAVVANFAALGFVYFTLNKSNQWAAFKNKIDKEIPLVEDSEDIPSLKEGITLEYDPGLSIANGHTTYTHQFTHRF